MTTVNNGPTFLSFNGQDRWQPSVDGHLIVRDPLVSVQKGLYAKVLIVHLTEIYKVESIFWQVSIVTGDCEDEGT
jgi:acetylcholinesterase